VRFPSCLTGRVGYHHQRRGTFSLTGKGLYGRGWWRNSHCHSLRTTNYQFTETDQIYGCGTGRTKRYQAHLGAAEEDLAEGLPEEPAGVQHHRGEEGEVHGPSQGAAASKKNVDRRFDFVVMCEI